MNCKTIILKGTIVLTVANIISRIMGFLFRIYLSHVCLPFRIGTYQLLLPLYTFMAVLTSGGIKTALIKIIPEFESGRESQSSYLLLKSALTVSIIFSVISIFFIQKYSGLLSEMVYGNPDQSKLIRLLVLALPFSSVHNCICGYFLAVGNFKVPVLSQILEQSVRIITVVLLKSGTAHLFPDFSLEFLVAGCIISEISSSVFCVVYSQRILGFKAHVSSNNLFIVLLKLFKNIVPLTFTQILPSLFHTFEACMLPYMLGKYGYSHSFSLSIYGILTGMVLPCIVFPSALTQSLATTLLPAVSALNHERKKNSIIFLIKHIFFSCFIFGIFWNCIFFIMGKFIGNVIFGNGACAVFIKGLSFICPFLYVNSSLISCINGLGKTMITLKISLCSITIRILFIYLTVPLYGIPGYLWGLLAAQIFITLSSVCVIYQSLSKSSES